jgi:hypothetical protein
VLHKVKDAMKIPWTFILDLLYHALLHTRWPHDPYTLERWLLWKLKNPEQHGVAITTAGS